MTINKKILKFLPTMLLTLFITIFSMVFTASCATNSNVYREIDLAVEHNDFAGAVEALIRGQEASPPIYPERNAIMLFLDKGLLEHYAGNYRASSQDLQEAERLIEEAYTRSITANFMTFIANDNTREYPGEDFEDIYLNVFNALNYYHSGDIEGALVEIRKLSMSNGKLDLLARRHEYRDPETGASLEELVMNETGFNQLPPGRPVNFSNSALARYLAALFYLEEGNPDSARIEFEQIPMAFIANRNVYQHPIPNAVEEARNVPEGMARLNIIGFAGLSPVKEEETVVQYFPFFRHPLLHTTVLKLPALVPRSSEITHIEVVVDGHGSFNLELLEDMGAVIAETFAVRYSSILVKTYIRTMIKYLAADIAAAATAESGGNFSELAAFGVALAAKRAVEASESADIRMSRYLPNRAYIGGINLPPGTYDVTVNFHAGHRVIARNEYRDVEVRQRGLNLISTVSLR